VPIQTVFAQEFRNWECVMSSSVQPISLADHKPHGLSDWRSVYDFVLAIYRADSLLFQLGSALVLLALISTALLLAYPSPVSNLSVWIKPIKFDISFGTYAWTVAWWISLLRNEGDPRILLRRSFFFTIAIEVACISLQAGRTAIAGRSVRTPLDSAIGVLSTTMIFFNTLLVIWIAFVFWREAYGLSSIYSWANRLGLLIFLFGNAIGGQMLAHHGHTIGAPNNSAGLPFLNWSTIGGDLRISHFLSIHAIQVLPLAAFLLTRVRPHWPERKQRLAIFVTASAFSAFVLLTYLEAILGIPFLRP